ncbi:hypothetical protein AJ80_08211 [Polytolypa hystricis UAMH7299]|uniref:Endoplasmic reticulum junction formation protein lunapark n=1 Tax=Polytolypa hystricis (strain UAMH7299) TaxID=1447883 RepID=A0A2B7XB40_POLH7|nr:hypothetical protein AJ80_08211 [Polytolypa hystricis UAMH7299]
MVTFWPWKLSNTSPKGPDNSPASFEKTLSSLSAKIAQTTKRLDSKRQRARRFKALWTLYSTFTYLLVAIILTLVLGWQRWGPVEYSALSGGPVVIYIVRASVDTYYQYRISKTSKSLAELHKQRESTIEKLKEATKYNSTQQLLEKYGGESPKPPPAQGGPEGDDGDDGSGETKRGVRDPRMRASLPFPAGAQGRTGIPPPPTANIQRKMQPGSLPTTPIRSPPPPQQQQQQQQTQPPTSRPQIDEPGFAPNAFPKPPPPQLTPAQPRWYDRLLDVLLGEDETQPKNRLVLICSHCRLVNGQAAPGVRTVEELGRWRCMACGAWNGEEPVVVERVQGHEQEQRMEPSSLPDTLPKVTLGPPSDEGAWEPVSNRESGVSSEIEGRDDFSSAGDDAEGEGGEEEEEDTDVSVVDAPTTSGEDDVGEEEEPESGFGSGSGVEESVASRTRSKSPRKRMVKEKKGKVKGKGR